MSYVDNNLKKADKFYKLKEFDKANDFYNLILSKFPKNQRALKGINLIKNLKSNSNSCSDGTDIKNFDDYFSVNVKSPICMSFSIN